MGDDSLADVRMHPMTLSFSGVLEHDFLANYNQKTLKQIRFALFVCAFFSGFYAVFDTQLFPTVKVVEEFFSYYILIPFIVIAYLLTHYLPALRYIQAITSGVVILRGLVTVSIMVSDTQIANFYITGLLLGVVVGFTICRLRFIYSTAASLIVLIAYVLCNVLPFSSATLSTSLLNNCADMTIFIILGMFMS